MPLNIKSGIETCYLVSCIKIFNDIKSCIVNFVAGKDNEQFCSRGYIIYCPCAHFQRWVDDSLMNPNIRVWDIVSGLGIIAT